MSRKRKREDSSWAGDVLDGVGVKGILLIAGGAAVMTMSNRVASGVSDAVGSAASATGKYAKATAEFVAEKFEGTTQTIAELPSKIAGIASDGIRSASGKRNQVEIEEAMAKKKQLDFRAGEHTNVIMWERVMVYHSVPVNPRASHEQRQQAVDEFRTDRCFYASCALLKRAIEHGYDKQQKLQGMIEQNLRSDAENARVVDEIFAGIKKGWLRNGVSDLPKDYSEAMDQATQIGVQLSISNVPVNSSIVLARLEEWIVTQQTLFEKMMQDPAAFVRLEQQSLLEIANDNAADLTGTAVKLSIWGWATGAISAAAASARAIGVAAKGILDLPARAGQYAHQMADNAADMAKIAYDKAGPYAAVVGGAVGTGTMQVVRVGQAVFPNRAGMPMALGY